MKTAILVDSVAVIKDELRNLPNVFEAKLTVNYPDGSTMEDTKDLAIIDGHFEKMENFNELPSTSQPSFGQLHAIYDQMIEEGYTRVIGVALSSQLSGTYSAFVTTAEEYEDKIESYHFDSLSAALVQERMVTDILPLVESEAPIEEIESIIQQIKQQSSLYIVVEELTNLRKGGRLTASSALLGTLLRVKPLLKIDEEGKLVVSEKIRTSKRVAERLVQLATEAIEQNSGNIRLGLLYTDSTSQPVAEDIKARIQAKYPNIQIDVSICGPVISTHTGKGTYGLAIYPAL